ncbi:oxidoreductase, partial [Burkholderia pseudomallei]
MDFVKSITQAATQASIAAERAQHVSRVYERNRAASRNTVDTLTKLATGNLTSAAELLNGASSALSVATDLSPKVG